MTCGNLNIFHIQEYKRIYNFHILVSLPTQFMHCTSDIDTGDIYHSNIELVVVTVALTVVHLLLAVWR